MQQLRAALLRHRTVPLAALGCLGVALVAVAAHFLPVGVDWEAAFRPAAREVLALRSPYNIEGYLNPPWLLALLLPLALLPPSVGYGVLVVMSLAGFAYAAYRFGAKPLTLAVFLASPPVIHSLLNGNVDFVPVLGFVLPPQIGLFFVTVKPQMGWVVVVFWLVEGWRQGGWREVARVFGPVTLAAALSFVLWGLWPLRFERELQLWWNASLWPASIPVGVALAVAAIRTRRIEYAMGASPCLSPYVLLHGWAGALCAVTPRQAETLAAVAGLWTLVAIRAVGS